MNATGFVDPPVRLIRLKMTDVDPPEIEIWAWRTDPCPDRSILYLIDAVTRSWNSPLPDWTSCDGETAPAWVEAAVDAAGWRLPGPRTPPGWLPGLLDAPR